MIREEKDQESWKDIHLDDIKNTPLEQFYPFEESMILKAGDTEEEALEIVSKEFELVDGIYSRKILLNAIQSWAIVSIDNLKHVVEKRKDARERFSKLAHLTLLNPFEVWKIKYSDGGFRLAFIGIFSGSKNHILLILKIDANNNVLWNFMQCELKKLNKHRLGELLYKK
ncbi:PBECR2 nuclease fold domain-containing protein [Acinetobacter venetianus]|uniref:PBECR2 nuclease fold domain-containing protein n=1 Tax=Acinetobacter venetianus TaxID=52133 RepID=UPI00214FD8D3|nr:PBECR2 nuclease fold domain-containing protein [Acinetobacter venetianus]MCR4532698.1 PBECR2 nuclease fold domain-containing protein [Acinetobacter venetianus]